MIRVFLIVVLVGFMSACASTPEPAPPQNKSQWTLEPTTADQKLFRDDQFLQKAQKPSNETAGMRSRRRPFLKP